MLLTKLLNQLNLHLMMEIYLNQICTAWRRLRLKRYLGVLIDNKLNINEHVNHSSKKAIKLLNLCRRNLYMCPPDVKATAYNAIVRPHLDTSCKVNIKLSRYWCRRSVDTKSLNWLPIQHQHSVQFNSFHFKFHYIQIFSKN